MASLSPFSPAFLIVVSALAGIQQTTPKKDIPALTRRALKSVVLVVASDATGEELRQGSGFVVSSDGKVVTNHHVIEGAESAVIKFPTGAYHMIEGVVASDAAKDIVILKASGSDFPALVLGDSDRVETGEDVVAIGSPLALEATVSTGIISGIRDWENLKVFQTTAPISAGSSGGPLLNLKGEVIGITTFQMRGGQSLNFALPVNRVKLLLASSDTSQPRTIREGPSQPSKITPETVTKVLELAERAEGLSRKGLYLEAEQEYRAALKLNPQNPGIHSRLAELLKAQKGRIDDAIAECRAALAIEPDWYPALATLASLLDDKGELEEAATVAVAALHFYPEDPMAHSRLGSILTAKGDFDGAVAEWKEAIRLLPEYSGNYHGLGNALEKKGVPEPAIAAYREALRRESNPTLIQVYRLYLGNALAKKGDISGAILEMREAVRLKPDDPYAHMRLGFLLFDSHDLKGAIEEFRRALGLRPDDPDLHYTLALALRIARDWRDALDHFRDAHLLDPKNPKYKETFETELRRHTP